MNNHYQPITKEDLEVMVSNMPHHDVRMTPTIIILGMSDLWRRVVVDHKFTRYVLKAEHRKLT